MMPEESGAAVNGGRAATPAGGRTANTWTQWLPLEGRRGVVQTTAVWVTRNRGRTATPAGGRTGVKVDVQ